MARTAKKETALTAEEKLARALVPEAEQPYQVPENWCWSKVGIICSFERGITFPASAKEFEPTDNNIPCLRTANVQDELDTDDLIYVDRSYMKGNSAKLTQANDIIMSSANSRELVGKVSFVSYLPCPMTFGGFVLTIRTEQIQSKYLFFFLRYEFLLGKFMGESTQTTNIANINTTKLADYQIPLPPLAEQQRIVDRIESLFAKLDEAKEKAQAVVDGFEERRTMILHKAFSGELTANWRRTHNVSEASWELLTLNDVADYKKGPFGSSITKAMFVPKGEHTYKVYEQGNAIRKTLDYGHYYINEQKYNELKGFSVQSGDIIISCAGTIGEVYKLPEECEAGVINQALMRVRLHSNIEERFFSYYFGEVLKGDVIDQANGTAIKNIPPFKVMKAMEIRLPSFAEQKTIVNLLDEILQKEEQAQEAAEQVIDQIDTMKKAILALAFRGELGTYDPTDESAEELLKRVL